MDRVGTIGKGNPTDSAKTLTQTKTFGKEDFFKMLIAQLKNQDPMNPLEGTEFSAQLAQFSSLEQLANLNTAVASQNQTTANLINAQGVNFIGKEVTARVMEGVTETTTTGLVTAVNFKDQAMLLTVNGQDIPFKDVLSVKNNL